MISSEIDDTSPVIASEAKQSRSQRRKTGLLPPSLFELRRTQSSQELLAMTELAIPNQPKIIML
jgi:hypothetical protein